MFGTQKRRTYEGQKSQKIIPAAHTFLTSILSLRTLKTNSNYTANLIYDILSSGAFVIPVTEFSLCLETPVRSVIVSVSRSYRAVPSQI